MDDIKASTTETPTQVNNVLIGIDSTPKFWGPIKNRRVFVDY
jgi:hypothetical protein